MTNRAIEVTSHQFISFDETAIHYLHVKSSEPPKAVAIIVHGMGEHAGRYRNFAEYLSTLGITSYLPDLRGFGKSGGKRACVRSFGEFHRDLEALHSYVGRNHEGVPLFLVGHSFGGLITSSYLAFCKTPKVNGLILSSPIFGIGVPVPRWRDWLAMLMSVLFPDYTEPSRVKPELLTHDLEILELYAKDDLIFHMIGARLYVELKKIIDRRRQIAMALRLPVLVLQAGEDHIVSKEKTLLFFEDLKIQDKELEIYNDFYHEILNESRRDLVYSRMGRWILSKLSYK